MPRILIFLGGGGKEEKGKYQIITKFYILQNIEVTI